MTVTIDIRPEKEGLLQENAVRAGVDIPEFVQQMVESNLTASPVPISGDEWLKLLVSGTISAPSLTNEQTSREYIYED